MVLKIVPLRNLATIIGMEITDAKKIGNAKVHPDVKNILMELKVRKALDGAVDLMLVLILAHSTTMKKTMTIHLREFI